MNRFHIDAAELSWLPGCEAMDLCLHGNAVARIGKRRLEYNCTVSSAGLYLLKSLTEDHMMFQEANQMLPCCGHFIIPAEDGESVHICGCPNGEDWTVRHEAGAVVLILEDGYTVTVPMAEYRREVLAFAEKIEDFYNAHPRTLPEDEWERENYLLFWKEWHRRREQAQ